MRSLSAEEAALWARVAATIKPLSREPPKEAQTPEVAAQPANPPPSRRFVPRPVRPESKPAPAPMSEATLDRSWDRRLRTGALVPDRVLDLHGHSLDRAWQAIDRTLEQAVAAGDRVVLLVTGHERAGEPPIERGKIRAAVHDWLAVSRHSASIAAVRGAHRRHGGGGSLYLVLKRRKRAGSTLS